MAPRRDSNPDMENEILGSVPGFDDQLELDLDTDGDQQSDDQQQQDDGDQQQLDDQGDGQQQQQQQQDDSKLTPEQKAAKAAEDAKKGKGKQPVLNAEQNATNHIRRLDTQNKRLKGLLDDTNKQVISLRTQLAEVNYLQGVPAKLGLSADEVATGMDLVAVFKSNPEQAVTMILAEAAARGVNLQKILGNTSGVDTQAISRLLDQKLGPFEQANKQKQEEAAVIREATQRYNSFLASYPDAETHQDAIASLMREGKARNEEIAYFMLREFAVRNGFDFDQPLGPQIQAKVNGGNQNQQQQQRQNNQQQRKPMGNGRPVGRQASVQESRVASPDRSYSSIIEEALAEQGM